MKRSLYILLILLISVSAHAQKAEFEASVDKNPVQVSDRFKLTLILKNERGNISAPDLGGLRVVQGPFQSSNYSIVNGVASSHITHTYTLMAPNEGTYTIGQAIAHVKNARLASDPITVKVIKGPSVKTESSRSKASPGPNKDLFVNVLLSKDQVYRGEQVVATYKLYSRFEAIELSRLDMPVLNGFWSEDVKLKNNGWESKLETINGVRYKVAILKRQVLFPQRSGDLTIDPVEIECVVNRTFFSRGTKMEIRSNTAKLKVKDLPSSKPPTFSGAVGALTMKVNTDKTDLKENDAVNLSVVLSGRSNLKLIDPPDLVIPKDLEVYDPKVEDRISVNSAGMNGTRSFEYLIIPRHAGEHRIEPFTITYFDTDRKEYVDLSSSEIVLSVSKGDGSAAATYDRPTKEQVELLDEDIRYIKTGTLPLAKPSGGFFGSPLYIGGMLTPALAFILFLFIRKKRVELNSDEVSRRTRVADKMARRKLNAAEKALKKNDGPAVFEHTEKALLQYLGDKFDLALVDRTSDRIETILADRNIERSLIDRTKEVLAACQMARYSPVSDSDANKVFNQALELFKALSAALK